jgi:tetratricopeptide (TPR) repeat protein
MVALKELFMRFAPAAAALSLVFAVTASVGSATEREASPRAAMLIAEGKAALAAGDSQRAIDALEAALVVDPGYTPIFLHLAEVARHEDLQGKAIRYYREALARDPDNFAAISGEGAALLEKGAVEKARGNLAKLQSMCGSTCPETLALETSLSADAAKPRMAAEASSSESAVSQN